ncbi:family 78 glycoside hydrolase catalytic domain [Actinacidiphila acidipaludis]|uniref:alpha-L-rhamnosidase n=1 Tax=Actinacidiphila acidipaludis TaxID=2873382 RepID=A0ABS7QFS1_9ACTN|nr:family 78 glycoside hydrolase catalytic domain [Streptomyces acidipaludis]MBY8882009.1 glycoside hydrolase family 78 protein [Streptomyces acidipaludis]
MPGRPPPLRRRAAALLGALPLLAAALLTGPAAHADSGGPEVHDPVVDGTADPQAVTEQRPGLGWQLTSPHTGELQTAYRILVADSPARLTPGRADVWDSGKVSSDESVRVPYGGPALAAGHRYYWKVRVWDNHGEASGWSRTATWDTALASPADWKGAQWITPDRSGVSSWSDFTLDTDFTVKYAAAAVVFRAKDASDYYMWQINNASSPGKVLLRPHVDLGGRFTTLKEVDLSPVITPADAGDRHHLRIRAEGSTITTWVDGTQVDTLTDTSLTAGTIGFRESTTAGRQEDSLYDGLTVRGLDGTTLFSDDFSTAPDPSFPGTKVTDGELEPAGDPTLLDRDAAAPMLRTTFTLDKKIARAHAYVYGLGLYELHLNGAKVGDHVLAPAGTPYTQRNLYDTYDVTSALRQGGNAVGIWLGTGYGPHFSPYGFRWTGPPQAVMLIDVTYADGTRKTVTTDPSWKWSTGPILADDLYDGEVYDARAAQPGWDTSAFDDAAWHPVTTATAPSSTLVASTMPPVKVVGNLAPVKVTQPRPGSYVYDFGQNFAGWERLTAHGPAGTAITLRTAEELNADGTLDTTTNRNAASTDTFVLAGTGGAETYEPRFTYHGFRYLEVTGYPGTPTAADVTGRVVHADVTSTGTFGSSDPLLNTIWRNNRWSILNNSMSMPTDNPVRDERTPPGMDVQAYHDASVREFGMDAFYANYLADMPPGTALPNDAGNAQQPDMGGDQVTLAWTLYEQYGDLATLAADYPAMRAFVDKNATDVPGHIWPDDHGFGDWCPPYYGPGTNDGMGSPGAGSCFSEVSLVNTALSYLQAADVAKAAQALGRTDDAAHYSALADSVKDAFNAHFLNSAGDTYGDGRQVTSILPLAFGMVPPDRTQAVGDQFVRTLTTTDGGHLDTGIFGTRYLVDALAAIGRTDLAMTALDKTDYPGFGFEIAHNATSSWEEWLYSSGMETHDHAMFAGVNASLYTALGGVRPASAGYRTVTVAPQVPAGLRRVSVTQDTVRGRISSSWVHEGTSFDLTVTLPANSTAVVRVPVLDAGRTVHAPAGAAPVGGGGTTAVSYRVGSGTWHFHVG